MPDAQYSLWEKLEESGPMRFTDAVSYGPPRPDKAGEISVLNAYEVLPLLERHNVLGVFRGHTHITEVVTIGGHPFCKLRGGVRKLVARSVMGNARRLHHRQFA